MLASKALWAAANAAIDTFGGYQAASADTGRSRGSSPRRAPEGPQLLAARSIKQTIVGGRRQACSVPKRCSLKP